MASGPKVPGTPVMGFNRRIWQFLGASREKKSDFSRFWGAPLFLLIFGSVHCRRRKMAENRYRGRKLAFLTSDLESPKIELSGELS